MQVDINLSFNTKSDTNNIILLYYDYDYKLNKHYKQSNVIMRYSIIELKHTYVCSMNYNIYYKLRSEPDVDH